MVKVYQSAGGGGMPDMGGMGGAGAPPPAGGPTVEEVRRAWYLEVSSTILTISKCVRRVSAHRCRWYRASALVSS